MRNRLLIFSLLALTAAPAMAATGTGRSESQQTPWERNSLSAAQFGFSPQLGFVNYNNRSGEGVTRFAIGAGLDMNVLKFWNPVSLDSGVWSIGPATGVVFSHTGAANSNFFGFDSIVPDDLGSNLIYVPADLKVSYLFNDRIRAGVHAGANLVLRTNEGAIQMGEVSPNAGSGADLSFFPNIGVDLDYVVSNDVILTLRPDLMLTSGPDVFTGTLALSFPLGVS